MLTAIEYLPQCEMHVATAAEVCASSVLRCLSCIKTDLSSEGEFWPGLWLRMLWSGPGTLRHNPQCLLQEGHRDLQSLAMPAIEEGPLCIVNLGAVYHPWPEGILDREVRPHMRAFFRLVPAGSLADAWGPLPLSLPTTIHPPA